MSITDAVNCACSDTTTHKTLSALRGDMMSRLGYGAQAANPPPGMAGLLNGFLIEAQELLYARPTGEFRTERFYSWPLTVSVRKYTLISNAEQTDATTPCTKILNPRQITWVGIERDGVWTPLAEGIAPEWYANTTTGIPQRYEIRQCIELWPAPAETLGNLVIKGHFELEPFTADTDKTTINSRAVFLLALANAKAHYRQPDASNYVQQLEVLIASLVAGSHGTRRYIPGGREVPVYVRPAPSVPFA